MQAISFYITQKLPKGKKARYIRLDKEGQLTLTGDSKFTTCWEISKDTGIEHPTQKPVELALRAIENSSQPGEIVLDLFGGSGTTLIGAEMTGRVAHLTELDPKYCDVIVNRYARITGNITGYCVRDGQTIPYAQLKQENDEANGREQELR